jgi:hypothetical protein
MGYNEEEVGGSEGLRMFDVVYRRQKKNVSVALKVLSNPLIVSAPQTVAATLTTVTIDIPGPVTR